MLGLLLLGRAAAGDLLGGAWTLYAEQHTAALTQTGGVLRIEVRRPSEPFYLTKINQGLATPLPVYLDRSLQAFDEVLPAAGSVNSALRISPQQMAELTQGQWVDACQ